MRSLQNLSVGAAGVVRDTAVGTLDIKEKLFMKTKPFSEQKTTGIIKRIRRENRILFHCQTITTLSSFTSIVMSLPDKSSVSILSARKSSTFDCIARLSGLAP